MAEIFREAPVFPVTIVTSNLPVGEMLSSVPGLNVFLTAGQILGRQFVLLGETARESGILELRHRFSFLTRPQTSMESGIPRKSLFSNNT